MTAADWTTIGQPQDIRLVVADMDGTLLDERSRIPDGFWPMLARLKRRGVEFVPASGRQYATLRNMFAGKAAEILDGGELSYIAENGNVVALDGKVVEVHGVDLDVTRHVIDLVADAAALPRDGRLCLPPRIRLQCFRTRRRRYPYRTLDLRGSGKQHQVFRAEDKK